ncbi:GvpL/GvpF family gas vesicle protein [Amycolatopsis carbonis]|uniref:GvpL/GvpF family gas vesicle protein n=1 Tax=Amycolatopsis carbonis TaxID=715471 RepID=A0A9Y2I873_9PSEU|nr:GvpL/GvpF family gas vesicle protein [Amycolatopsis sp. 2-15]WIX75119.1 GvpL/GvpF family gas vesicle protein [Amycolatopsis sp. 2-15]WIX75582.1 GvpL/GvpF family gas vesicle protein [Amycolatopsis sp. 2-15]
MAAEADTGTEIGTETAIYVYGILPADVEIDDDARGVGDPPAEVTTVHSGPIAALVSEIPRDAPLGRPEDLSAHASLLDSAAAEVPVLPLRFGAVVADERAVVDELLDANRDDFTAALEQLEGMAEYVVRARYDEQAILREILSENDRMAQLAEAIRGKPEDATRNERMALGEQITQAIEAKRAVDTQLVADALTELVAEFAPRQPTHDEEAVHLAVLAETDRQDDLEAAIGELATEWDGRVAVRLLGPLAAYDFVVTRTPE